MKTARKHASLAVVVILILSTLGTSASAETLSSKLAKQKSTISKQKAQLKTVQAKIDSLEIQIETLDNKIELTMAKIDANKKEINKTETAITKAEAALEVCETSLDETQALFAQRMKAMYVTQNTGYLQLLLSSKGISEFFSNLEAITSIINYDVKVKNELNNKITTVSHKKSDLKAKKQALVALNKDNADKMTKLNSDRKSQLVLIAQVNQQKKKIDSSILSTQKQINATLKQLAAIKKTSSKTSLSRGSDDISSNSIVAFAATYLGTPYVWGGTHPSPGFDCSGFTQYVFAHFGIHISRTTDGQIHDGIAVSRSNLQPGDLILFGTGGDPHHVGIYVGNGAYIHSPHTGDVVKISLLSSRSDFIIGRRVN